MLEEYDVVEQDICAILEEESVDDQIIENKIKAPKSDNPKKASSFYLTSITKEDLVSLIEAFYLLFSNYYSRMMI